MKIGIINPNIIENDPYVTYYIDVLESLGVEYKYIGWNRNSIYPKSFKNKKMEIFQYSSPESNSNFRKLLDFYLFTRFVIGCLKKENYSFLVIHTIVSIAFLGRHLTKYYSNHYILDIRDYSIVYPFVKGIIEKAIQKSAFTTISSLGYKTWLPPQYDYVMGHNVRKCLVDSALNVDRFHTKKSNEIVVLTIGQIRYFSSNARLIVSLGDKKNIQLVFAGNGSEKNRLEKFFKGKYSNVVFTGKYKKEDEPKIVETADFINIILPNDGFAFNTLMSNRFYLSLIFKVPMIVNDESVQAKWVQEYRLGFVVSSKGNLYEELLNYYEHYDYQVFSMGCEKLLRIISKDILSFENKIKEFIKI